MKKIKIILIIQAVFFTAFALFASAAPVSNIFRSVIPEADNTYYIGTTTPSNLRYNGVFNNVSITGTCTGCSTGGGNSKWASSTDGLSIFTNSPANVAVGSTTPWSRFSISATSSASKMPLFDIETPTTAALATTSVFKVTADGNVGVGTTSPMSLFSVNGSLQEYGLYSHFGTVPTRDSTYCDVGKQCLGMFGNDNTLSGVNIEVGNQNAGASAYSFFGLVNDLSDSTGLHYAGVGLNSSVYNDNTFGTGLNTANNLQLVSSDGPITMDAATNTSVGYLNFLTGGSATANERMRITSTGNVGIASTTPWATLAVNPVAGKASNQFVVGSSTKTSLVVDNSGNVGIGVNVPAVPLELGIINGLDTSAAIRIGRVNSVARFHEIISFDSATQALNYMNFAIHNGTLGATTSALRLFGDGNVSIGTTSSITKLAIGPLTSTFGTAVGSGVLAISNAGAIAYAGENTGASGSAAGSFAALYSNDGAAMASGDRLGGFLIGGASSATSLRNSILIGAFAEENWVDASTYASNITFSTTALSSVTRTEKMRLSANGNLGISSTSPWATLAVNPIAGGASNQFVVGSSTATAFVINNSGRVGIGTTTPAFKFDLNGLALLEPTASSTSIFSGILWNDSSQNQLAFSNGNTLYHGGNLYSATTAVTLNSATPTTAFSTSNIGTTTIAANSLKVGQRFTIWGAGYYSTPIGNTATVTITPSIASTTVTTISTVTTAIFPASATNLPYDFRLNCTVRSTGATGTLVCDGTFNYATALTGVSPTSNSLSTVGTIPFDSTVKEALDVKVSWSAVTTQTATVQEAWIDF